MVDLVSVTSPNTMLEAYLSSLWNPADERAIPSPSEKDRTQSIIDELQQRLNYENSIIDNTSEIATDHQRPPQILEELQKRKLFIAPIRRVPDDVLVEILDLASRGARRQIWRFSHVCRYWRQLCHSYAWLWSHIEVDLTVDCPCVGLVSKWRERAWATNQTIDLRLGLEQFGALKGMLEGGLKYITHLRLSIRHVANAPPKFDLPPALPCLRRLALNNDAFYNPEHSLEGKVYITSLCHRFFTRRQTRRRGSGARFHLEFYNLAFSKLLRVMNCVHTVVLRKCTFAGPSQILEFLEAAKFTIKYLEYTYCWARSSEPSPYTLPLTFPLLSTLKHYASESTYQFPILPVLSCPALKALTISEDEATLCTIDQYPAIQELCLVRWDLEIALNVDCPLARDSIQLETLTISHQLPSPPSLVRYYRHMNLDIYTKSLRRIQIHLPTVYRPIEEYESELWEVANEYARRGHKIEFELVQGRDCGISFKR